MGQGGSELGSWRDELTARDGEDTHGDVTRDFSSQWKHGARFTVRAAQSLFWLTRPQPRLLCSLFLSRFPSVPSAFRSTLWCHGSLSACPPHPPLVCSLTRPLTHSSSRFLLSRYYVPGAVLGGRGGETEKGTVGSSIGVCAVEGKWTLNPHFLKFHPPHSHFKCLSCHKAFPESSARGACSLLCILSP